MDLTVKDGDFGLRRNTHQAGFGLNADTDTKKRREYAGLFGHGDNGGTIGDAENPARLAVKADHVADTETEWRKGLHLEL
jgi:hypothetical protein